MQLYFLRHGIAEDAAIAQRDFDRALTDRGIERLEAEVAALIKLGLTFDLLLSSPYVRALQTAQIVADRLDLSVQTERALGSGCTLAHLSEALHEREARGSVLVVGHEPDFSDMIGELIGGGYVEMKKGSLACLDVQAPVHGGGVLAWLLTGKQLALLGEG
jgi:phosphohistidine phosphatase